MLLFCCARQNFPLAVPNPSSVSGSLVLSLFHVWNPSLSQNHKILNLSTELIRYSATVKRLKTDVSSVGWDMQSILGLPPRLSLAVTNQYTFGLRETTCS